MLAPEHQGDHVDSFVGHGLSHLKKNSNKIKAHSSLFFYIRLSHLSLHVQGLFHRCIVHRMEIVQYLHDSPYNRLELNFLIFFFASYLHVTPLHFASFKSRYVAPIHNEIQLIASVVGNSKQKSNKLNIFSL